MNEKVAIVAVRQANLQWFRQYQFQEQVMKIKRPENKLVLTLLVYRNLHKSLFVVRFIDIYFVVKGEKLFGRAILYKLHC